MDKPAVCAGAPLQLSADFPRDLPGALTRAAERSAGAGTVTLDASGRAEFLSYPVLLDRARRTLGGLREHGVAPGDHVIVHSANLAEYLCGFWACVLGGARPLLIARPSDPDAAEAATDRVRRATSLLDRPPVLASAAELAALSGCGAPVWGVAECAEHPPDPGVGRPADADRSDDAGRSADGNRSVDPDVALLLMSSGSTGEAKLVQLTHRGLVEAAAGVQTMLPLRPGEVSLNWLPLDHSGAFLLYHLYQVFAGGTNIHVPTDYVLADPLRWLDLIAQHQVNHAWAPNFGYQLVNTALREHRDRHWDLGTLRTLVSGGEQVTLPVMREFLDRMAPFGVGRGVFRPAWGMTETCTAITFARFDDPECLHHLRSGSLAADPEQAAADAESMDQTTLVSIGVPAPGATLRVVDENHTVLPEGRVGRLQVQSARVTPGYYGNPDADRDAFPEGDWPRGDWLDTGDLAFIKNGQAVIAGRRSDRIILNGHNYYAHDIEAVASGAPGVAPGLVAACGAPDSATGTERLAVFFVAASAGPGTVSAAHTAGLVRQELFTRLRLTAQVVCLPREEFPRTPSGKVQRAALRRRLLNGDFVVVKHAGPPPDVTAPGGRRGAVGQGPAAGPPSLPLRELVAVAFQEVLGGPVDEQARFYEVGVDSVTLVRLHHRLQRDLAREFPRAAMFEHPSLATLTRYLQTSALSADAAPAAGPGAVAGWASPSGAPPERAVAIIGMAARFPGAETLEDFWANLRDGVVSVRRFAPEELDATAPVRPERDGETFVPVSGALADVDAFDADFFGMSAREAELTDPAQRLFLECCYHALEHGGHAGGGAPKKIGVFAGSGMNLYTHQTYLLNNVLRRETARGETTADELDPITAMQSAIGSQPDFLAARVAYRLGLTGPAVGVQTACSTSLVAVHLACQALLSGDADLALAGAAAVHVPQQTGYWHFPGSILSGTGACRAFDADADGTVGGNGVAAVLLKPLDRALADGDPIHAVIRGSAVNNDGAGKVGFAAPSVPGQVEVIQQALTRAGVPAETISYLEAHGTGTPLGDPVEFRALTQAMRHHTDKIGFCTVGSVKPNIGHLDSCAGMAGLIKTALMLQRRMVPPLANFRRPNPELEWQGSPFVLAEGLRKWTTAGAPLRAGVSALGVGGTNAHVILEESPLSAGEGNAAALGTRGPVCDNVAAGVPGVLPLSADDPVAVAELAARTRDHLRRHPEVSLADLLATAAARPHRRCRIAAVGDTPAELADALDLASRSQSQDSHAGGHGAGPLAFGFTGQGVTQLAVTDSLYHRFPVCRRVLDECDQVHTEVTGRSLLAVLRAEGTQESGLKEPEPWPTNVAQPALFAVQAALVALWRSYEVEPDFVIGHSVGEYAALHTAGALSLADGIRLTVLRGELMQHHAPPGAMLAVLADQQTVNQVAADASVELAAVNGPGQHVVSGAVTAVEQVAGVLDGLAIPWQRLPVDRPFHSPLLDPILDEFTARAGVVRLAPLRIPLASTVTGKLLVPGSVVELSYLRRQIREPVRFGDAVQAVTQQGAERFLEIGPDAVLTSMGRRAAPDSRWVAALRRDADPARATWQALAELYCQGHEIRWDVVAPGGRRTSLPGYPFQRRRHWIGGTPAVGVPASAVPAAPKAPAAESAGPGPGRDRILNRVCELAARQLGAEVAGVPADRTFLELGADSLSMLRVAQDVRAAFDVSLGVRELFTDAETPAQLACLISDRMPRDSGGRAAASESESGPPVGAEPAAIAAIPAAKADAIPEARELIAEQLRIADQMVERVTALMREQLAVLDGHAASPPVSASATASPVDRVDAPATGRHSSVAESDATPRSAPTAPSQAPAPRRPHSTAAPKAQCDFSVYFFGDYPDQEQRDKYGLILDAARFADQHGFHAVWLPERHFHSFGGLFPNPVVLASALARETEQIRLHAGSVVLPLHQPIRVAEEWSVVDNLSSGRVGLCVASGWHANDFALNPEAYGRHRELTYQHLETLRELWSGEAVKARSGSGESVELRVYPRPVQTMPPLFTAVVSNPDSYRAAAAHDLGVVTNLMAQSVEQLADNIALYRSARADHGLDPGAGRVVVLVHTYLGDDLDAARRQAFGPFCDYLRSSLSLFGQVTNSLGLRIDESTPEEDVEFLLEQAYGRYCEGRALIGTVDSATEVVDRLLAVGADEVACFVDFGVSSAQVMRSLPLVDTLRQRYQRPTTPEPSTEPSREAAAEPRPEFGPEPGAEDQEPGPVGELALLSPAQRGIWFLEQLYPGRSSYHEPKVVRLDGPLDEGALRRALAQVAQRHETLRTVFCEVDGQPRQAVLPTVDVDCPLVERPDGEESEAIAEVLAASSRDLFDLETGPLWRARLIRLAERRHLLFLHAHHIIFDSLSTAVLTRDLAAFYQSVTPALPPLPVSYADHVRARALDPQTKSHHVEHWRSTLAGAPVLQLPTDRPRPPVMTERGAALTHELDGQLAAAVRRFSAHHRATPFMTLLSAVAAVLGRQSDQRDLVIGTALTHRPEGTEDLIGLFIDSVPLRIDLSGEPTLGELTARVRHTSTDAFDHAGVGFDEMVAALNPDRDASRNPLFQVLVEYENVPEIEFAPQVRATLVDVPSDRAPLDLTLYLSHHADGIRCMAEYNTDLFDTDTMRRLLELVEAVLRRATTDQTLALPALTAPADADRAAIARWSGAQREGPPGCLHELFERRAARAPEAVALIDGERQVTYRELDRLGNELAWRLHEVGAGPDSIVAVRLPRGVGLIAAILGVLKAGAAYLPLDAALPQARQDFMLADSGARWCVSNDERWARRLALPVLQMDAVADNASTAARSENPPPRRASVDDLAYCIYTSGSTGAPKGVAVPHRGPANLVAWYLRRRPPCRTLQWTSVSFDVSVQEIFTTLASGAALVLVSEQLRREPDAVAQLVRRTQAQRLFMPFTPLKYLMETGPRMPSLREVVSAGEALQVTPALRGFLADHPDCTLFNEYGPTEGSIIATTHQVDPDAGAHPPIGRPIDNLVVRVLDQHGRVVPVGATGEIYLGGACLAREYLGRPEETDAAFVPDPESGGSFLYRTRDLGRWLPGGILQHLGRADQQVKIRGHRVEPGEAEQALAALDQVRDVAVVAGVDPRGETCLIGYVALADDAAGSADGSHGVDGVGSDDVGVQLAGQLASTLPSYVIPSAWVRLPELPVNSSGKLDRGRLPEPDWEARARGSLPVERGHRTAVGATAWPEPPDGHSTAWDGDRDAGADGHADADAHRDGDGDRADVAPITLIEGALRDLWCAQLGVSRVAGDASFFQLGGHSLAAMELTSRVRKAFDVEYQVADLFREPTLRAMARQLEDLLLADLDSTPPPAEGADLEGGSDADSGLAPGRNPGLEDKVADEAPATAVQQRCWRLHQSSPNPAVYNVAHRVLLDGRLDPDALERALHALANRHGALRTRMVDHDGDLTQQVLASRPVELPVVDLEDISHDEQAVLGWCQDQAHEPFTLRQAPLWRACLGRLGDTRWVLVLTLHHIICDGWSMGVIWNELSTLYVAEVPGEPSAQEGEGVAAAAPQHTDYARWRAERAAGAQGRLLRRHWRAELTGAPTRLDLPYDRPLPDTLSGRGAHYRFRVPRSTSRRVERVAAALDSTPAQVLTAGFAVWLARLCGQRDMVLAVSNANRVRPADLGVVGPLGEATPLRLTLGEGTRFDELVSQVRSRLVAALEHHGLAFGEVLRAIPADAVPEQDPAASSPQLLFTVVTTPPPELNLPRVSAAVESMPVQQAARTELYVVLFPGAGGVEVCVEYSTDLFDERTVKKWGSSLRALLDEVTRAPASRV